MQDQRNSGENAFFMGLVTRVMLLLLVPAISSLHDSARAAGHDNACAETSTLTQTACYKAAAETYNLA
jgi:hypothetical protein